MSSRFRRNRCRYPASATARPPITGASIVGTICCDVKVAAEEDLEGGSRSTNDGQVGLESSPYPAVVGVPGDVVGFSKSVRGDIDWEMLTIVIHIRSVVRTQYATDTCANDVSYKLLYCEHRLT